MDGFSSLEELYNRVKPALKSKVMDLKRIGVNYVQIEDIWNYLRKFVWCKKNGLTLGEVVNDIMTISNKELEVYVQGLMAQERRELIKDEVL